MGTVATVLFLLGAFPAATGCKKDDAKPDPSSSSALTGANPAAVRLKPAQGNLATLLPAEVAKARARNLKPFVELRADWCGPCKELEAAMKDPRMVDAFAGTYLITLDVDEWSGKTSGMGLDSSSIPVFFELDDKGKGTGRKIDGGAWAENIPVNMAPPLKAFFTGK